MDEDVKDTGEMQGEEDSSITVDEDYTGLEGEAIVIDDDSDNVTEKEQVYEEALEIQQELSDIKSELKDTLLSILDKGKIGKTESSLIETLQDQYTEKYNMLKQISGIEMESGGSSTEKVSVDLDYNELMKAIADKADWLYMDENGQIIVNGDIVTKINWIIQSGTSKTNMTLTSELFDLVSKNISLTADRINLNGYVSSDEANWSIDTNGNMNAKNMNIEGYLSVNELRVGNIECSGLVRSITNDITLNVSTSVTATNEVKNGAYWDSLQACIDAIPSMLNGHTVSIQVLSDISEDIDIRGFSGGRLAIYLNSNTLYGNLFVRDNGARITVYGGSDTSAPSSNAVIKPSTPLNILESGISVATQSTTYFSLNYVNVYGKTNSSNTSFYYAVASYDGSNSYFKEGKIIGCDNAFLAQSTGDLYVSNSTGKVNNYVFSAKSGGRLSVNNDTQCNSASSTKTYKTTASQIIISDSFDKWDGATTDTGSNDNTTTSTKTVTYKSNYGDTYRSTVYKNWKEDNTVREGDYGYGDCNGVWFFGSQFSALQGKTITKVTIKITRQSGGSSGNVTHTLVAHNHSSRPSGTPSYLSGYSQTFSMAVGDTKTITITDSTVLNAISAGTCKGFGLKSAYDSSHYSVCSGNATVVITYK